MGKRYIDGINVFSSDELQYKFDPVEDANGSESVVLTEKILGERDVRLIRHNWAMHAMYHSLQMYKFAYIYSGAFLIYVDGKPTRVGSGALCIVPPGVVQKFTIDYGEKDMSDMVMINILLRASKIGELLPSVFARRSPVSDYLSETRYESRFSKFLILHSPSEMTREIAGVFFEEVTAAEEKNRSSETAYCLLNALLLSYLRDGECRCEFSVSETDNADPVNRIIACIQSEFRNITLAALCERFHYTPSYICRIVKKHTGMTFKEYLNGERLDGACKDLVLTEKPIQAVAADAGFRTLEHFYRLFRKKYGTTPQRYRRQAKNVMLSVPPEGQ